MQRPVPPLIVHMVYSFDTGGLENGIVNLINHMPVSKYRHAIVALCHIGEIRHQIRRDDVSYYFFDKQPGHGFWLYPSLYRLFRRLRPAIVHSRNLAALEAVVPAWFAGVRIRVHGEHGRDISDLDGSNNRYLWLRRMYRPFVNHYVALSRDLTNYLIESVGIPARQVSTVCNGVDAARFYCSAQGRLTIEGCPFLESDKWLIGTVGRMQTVKNQTLLAQAFIELLQNCPMLKKRLRLVMVGDGPLRRQCLDLLESAGFESFAWLPGERIDIPQIMRGLDCFVLPSLSEGISNSILEAMASGLPVIATNVGGNGELVVAGETGELVPSADPSAIARILLDWSTAPEKARRLGRSGRVRVEQQFSLTSMVQAYQDLYEQQLGMMSTRIG